MQTKDMLNTLKTWGNYDTADSDEFRLQVINEEIRFGELTLRCVNRRTHIEVFEVRRGKKVAGRFIPGNIKIGDYKKTDNIWQAKALITALKGSQDGIAILTSLVKEFYRDDQGKAFLTNMVEALKSENRLEELSRIVTARMMMNS